MHIPPPPPPPHSKKTSKLQLRMQIIPKLLTTVTTCKKQNPENRAHATP